MYLCLFITVTLGVYGILLIKPTKNDRMKERVDFFLLDTQAGKEEIVEEKQESFFKRMITPVLLDFKKSFRKRIPGEKEVIIDLKLQKAGNPFGMTPVDFRLVQAVSICLIPIIFAGYGAILHAGNGVIIIFVMIGVLVGFFAPHLYLKQKTKARCRIALREFPDVLDLLTVSLEAGLGFDAAVSKVVSKKEGVLVAEFQRCMEEIRLGKTRREALSGIRDRVDVDMVKSFISSVLQAEKLGIGMVRVLRVQSNEVREQRKQRAEEEAMKAPIKMLFPLVLFIFPSLFIVLLGPAVIQFIDTFKNG
ncbi:type II secretion system F family protein [Neobacillus sp. NPDC058068]|uniref:type II secretion system F family protein n=1 Tax=Neobacillus sp. NPDC058068 TaxID=3346325 RepID=UPI0036D7AF8B